MRIGRRTGVALCCAVLLGAAYLLLPANAGEVTWVRTAWPQDAAANETRGWLKRDPAQREQLSAEFAAAYQRWRALDAYNYTMDYVFSCCGLRGGKHHRAEVRWGWMVSRSELQDPGYLPPSVKAIQRHPPFSWGDPESLTVEDVFAEIRGALASEETALLLVEYDPASGLPLSLDTSEHGLHTDVTIVITRFHALPRYALFGGSGE